MSGFSVAANEHLIRSNLWSKQVKDVLLDELFATKYVRWLTDFPDGTTLNIPSIGQMEVHDYSEGNPIQYNNMDTGNFTFTIDKYQSSATWITEQMKQDSFYFNELVSEFVPKQARALAKSMEVNILSKFNAGQTASSLNTINGGDHRFVASGASATVLPKDFARARFALSKANVPMTNLVAIVDPSVGYALETMTNLVNVSNNPHWEGIVATGMSTGTRFIKNVYGFDVYESQNLPAIVSETVNGVSSGASAVANYLFSAAGDVLPMVGLVRQPPKVDSEYNKDFQREEYVTTCRYGFKLFRPENLVTLISATDQVS